MKTSRLHLTRAVLATVLIAAAVLAGTSAAARTSAPARVKTVPIINVYSHHPVDIVPGGLNASTKLYAKAMLWKNPAKRFELIYSEGGDTKAFRIRVPHSGLCLMLDFRELPYRNGTRVIQYNCNATKVRSRWWYAKRVIC
jgi:hypothetical protein